MTDGLTPDQHAHVLEHLQACSDAVLEYFRETDQLEEGRAGGYIAVMNITNRDNPRIVAVKCVGTPRLGKVERYIVLAINKCLLLAVHPDYVSSHQACWPVNPSLRGAIKAYDGNIAYAIGFSGWHSFQDEAHAAITAVNLGYLQISEVERIQKLSGNPYLERWLREQWAKDPA